MPSAVFSAALAGLALGAFSLGLLADRVGRKAVLVGATVCFGVFTICTALTPNLGVLLAYRRARMISTTPKAAIAAP
jgi:MFS transporter, AAHS family, 4-hydroxybenzoate transporter